MSKKSDYDKKFKEYTDAVEDAKQSKSFDKLYDVMCDIFQIKSVHSSVKEYIENTIDIDIIEGPVYVDGFAKSYKKGVASINHFFTDKNIPKDRFLPAFYFAYTESAHEYFLFMESGCVFGGFHESIWSEYFWDIFYKNNCDVEKSLPKFIETYGLSTFTYTQFEKMMRICREDYGITKPKQFPGKLKGDDFVKILTECGKNEDGRQVCYIDDIACSDVLQGMIDCFDDFYI